MMKNYNLHCTIRCPHCFEYISKPALFEHLKYKHSADLLKTEHDRILREKVQPLNRINSRGGLMIGEKKNGWKYKRDDKK